MGFLLRNTVRQYPPVSASIRQYPPVSAGAIQQKQGIFSGLFADRN
jgi:hypothetical protein